MKFSQFLREHDVQVNGFLGLTRDMMPQLSAADVEDVIIDSIASQGPSCEVLELDPFELHGSQDFVDAEKAKAITGELRPLLVSKENMIIDGHHRWWSARLRGLRAVTCVRISLPFKQAVEYVAAAL